MNCIKIKLFALIFIFIFGLSIPIHFAEEVDSNKVNEYIKAIEGFINKYSDVIEDEEESKNTAVAVKNIKEIINKYKLNDDEVLEVLNIVTKEHDVHKIVNKVASGDTTIPYDKDIALKFNIFELTVNQYHLFPWDSLTKEEVLMDKILPILNKSKNPAVIRYYLILSDGMFLDIWNQRLPMSYENKDKFSDKYIEIFKDENNSFGLRRLAIEAWTAVESREKEGIEHIEYILKNEDLFESSASFLWSIGNNIRRREKSIMKSESVNNRNTIIENKMLNILENNNLYSRKILNGVLKYFTKGVIGLNEDLKKRLAIVLEIKLKKETNHDLSEKYEYIINRSNEKE